MSENTGEAKRRTVLFAASECVPFIKTGGLADVAGALPKELCALGADVRVVLPKYKLIPAEYTGGLTHECEFCVKLGWRSQYCGVEKLVSEGITYYFIDNEYYFGRDYIYGSFSTDEAERYGFFCKAMLELMPRIGFYPDVLHLNDWQCGMAAALLKTQYGAIPAYRRIKAVFTVHNLKYQGVFPMDFVSELLSLENDCLTEDKLEYYGKVNYMKGGLAYADAITTVSPTYANEIQTPSFGETLDGLLRARSGALHGILNGIDESLYEPLADTATAARFCPEDLSGKYECKAALQAELGLNEAENVPLVCMVSRLTGQKGLDLIECVIDDMMKTGIQLVIVGTGERKYEQLFTWASWRYPGRVCAHIAYDEQLAHRVYSAGDMLLMPSLFEPCGLAQLIAMRYGTLPLVRETGGLKDTVQPYNRYTDEGTGFSFANYNAHEMLNTLERAVELYREDAPAWRRMMRRAMARKSGWERPAGKYMGLYKGMVEGK